MGGWRCSYRNCTVRSDGKTHMFHYPVFDKVRCHQWLVNSGRLDFLNLKVSQLKNRVVCQHHFKDDNFMNFKRDKLTFDAVPTLNGPFCENNTLDVKNVKGETEYTITFEDIENEYMTLNDKKANYSVKYGDFLSCNELADIDISSYSQNLYNTTKSMKNDDRVEIEVPPLTEENILASKSKDTQFAKTLHKNDRKAQAESKRNFIINSDLNYNETLSNSDYIKKIQSPPVLIVPPYSNITAQNFNTALSEPVQQTNILNDNFLQNTNDQNNILNNLPELREQDVKYIDHTTATPKPKAKEPKVRILSEKRISGPVLVGGKRVTDSFVLPIPKRIKTNTEPGETSDVEKKNTDQVDLSNILSKSIEVEPLPSSIKHENKSQQVQNTVRIVQEKSPRVSLLKKQITPERVAAIKEKRQFNMKLRDIIASFLDKLDEQDNIDKVTQNVSLQNKTRNQQARTCTSKEIDATSPHDTMAYLESRMNLMEEKLLNKIDQNSQKIVELKNSVVSVQKSCRKKSTGTQTITNEESHKKCLYQDISKYLSPDVNSLIYEELFINKYVQGMRKSSSPKRKRPR